MKLRTPPLPSGGVPRHRSAPVILAILAVACLSVSACLPQERGASREVDDGVEALRRPPAFPTTGPVPRELLIDGLLYDFTARPTSLDLWGPPVAEARCAATRITDTLGPPRLSELGYRPATSGASLNDIDLTDTEREFADPMARDWAINNPGIDTPYWVEGKQFKKGQTVTFKYRELTDDGVPKEARYWRRRDAE